MATEQYHDKEKWSEDERGMSEYILVSSSDEDINSEPDFDELARTGPPASPPASGSDLYEGPFDSLQAAYE